MSALNQKTVSPEVFDELPKWLQDIIILQDDVPYGTVASNMKKHKGAMAKIEAIRSDSYKFDGADKNLLALATFIQEFRTAQDSGMEGALSITVNFKKNPLEGEDQPPAVATQIIRTQHEEIRYL